MLNYEEITAELVQARVCKLIRRHIKESGRTYAEIAEIIDVEQRTLESWARSESAPKLYHFLRLVQFFPDSFTNESVELVGKTGVHSLDGTAINGRKLLTDVLGAANGVSKALEDGKIDHMEMATLKPILKKTAAEIDAFCAANGDNI